MNTNNLLRQIFNTAIAAADPCQALLNAVGVEKNRLRVNGVTYELDAYQRIVVVGAGKATAGMARAIEQLLGSRISSGLIVVKAVNMAPLKLISQIEASHPVPNRAGLEGTRKILEMASLADENTLFFCLLSGGASALLVAPVEGVSLSDKQSVTSLLLNSGANIVELNAVRKHLSAVKGGRLAQQAFPAQCVTLILSDVIGDPPDVIASGPMTPDASTFADAWSVIEKYKLQKIIPGAVAHHLQRGMTGGEAETVKPGNICLKNSQHLIIGGLQLALNAAREKLRQLGIAAEIIKTDLQGEARVAARYLAQIARSRLDQMRSHERLCLLSGGETTVSVSGRGMGGRNQELALAFAIEIEGLLDVSLLSAGTDSSDGNNVAAGAIVNGQTAPQARQLSIVPERYLADNDSYHFFQKFDAVSGGHAHLLTGPTGTNVMDIQIMLLDKTG